MISGERVLAVFKVDKLVIMIKVKKWKSQWLEKNF